MLKYIETGCEDDQDAWMNVGAAKCGITATKTQKTSYTGLPYYALEGTKENIDKFVREVMCPAMGIYDPSQQEIDDQLFDA